MWPSIEGWVETMSNLKARFDLAHCFVCGRKFGSEDIRMDVLQESRLVGAIHEDCYDLLLGGAVRGTDVETDFADASKDRIAG